MKGDHLWRVLVSRGIFEGKDEAVRWILAGKVLVNGQLVFNSGIKTDFDAAIVVKGLDRRYVGRGGYKLEGALRDFSINVSGAVVLDAGASRGGFTDCLVQHGAAKVYAVDAGYGQLAGALRSDSRVVNMEKTNIGQISVGLFDPQPVCATVDLSYLSLKKAIPIVAELISIDGSIISLVKPLFEIDDPESRRSGVITSDQAYIDILESLVEFVKSGDLYPVDVASSRIRGSKGTREFFLFVRKIPAKADQTVEKNIFRAVYGV